MSEAPKTGQGPGCDRRYSPRLANALLVRCLPADSVEDVLGDLEEAFHIHVAATGLSHARRWYWGQTLRLMARLPVELAAQCVPGRTSAFSSRNVHHLDGELDLPSGPEPGPRRSGGSSMSTIGQDLRYAFRTLAKAPGFTAIVILILGIGIGANTAVFSVLKAAFLQPLPYPEPNELTVLWNRGEDGGRGPSSGPNYLDWRSQSSTFEEMGAFGGRQFNLSGGEEPERMHGLITTGSIWDLLQVQPLMGRRIVSSDEEEGNTGVVVLSHALWRRRFGADPGILGQSIRVNGQPHTVIGVMPQGFQVPSP
ncbi:MAG: ABC transporter permease, partial [Gemmatimonadetes bacterium]|nr:ABC transporter permease [Gemmatimonadota bacterium]